jgi:hypothetical protein
VRVVRVTILKRWERARERERERERERDREERERKRYREEREREREREREKTKAFKATQSSRHVFQISPPGNRIDCETE